MATPRGAYLIGLAGFAVALVIVLGAGFSACYGFSAGWEDKVWGGRRGGIYVCTCSRRLAGGIYWYFYNRDNKGRMMLCIVLWWSGRHGLLDPLAVASGTRVSSSFDRCPRDSHIEQTMCPASTPWKRCMAKHK